MKRARSKPCNVPNPGAYGAGHVEGVTHNYVRHGTTLFAALNLASETVIGRCQRRHRHQEYLHFLKQIDASVPQGLAVHLIVDNYATHKHPRVQRWLTARKCISLPPIFLVEPGGNWVHIITQKAIRRGTFGSVKELMAQIDHFVRTYNAQASPFI